MPRTTAPASDPEAPLAGYRAKRNFATTQEPPATAAESRGNAPLFVVQKHQARRAGLHWDFRLEHNGVLWSWAVRKGPSLDPADKRIAVHVEDHPLDYAGFQGDIPEGNYGAGTVETWDSGTWQPLIDPDEGLRDGEIKFILFGTRLRGKFTLVRLRRRPGERGKQDNWLLIKGHDAEERAGADATALEAEIALPASANPPQSSGSRQDETVPRSAPARPTKTLRSKAARSSAAAPAVNALKAGLPDKQMPQLATVSDEAPDGGDWLNEIKFDGYRLLVFLQGGTARVMTRNGKDWTERLPAVVAAVDRLQVTDALVDGELVALDPQGHSSFPLLQAALAEGRDDRLFFYVFDLLHLDGWDLRDSPLRERKRVLRDLDHFDGVLRYSDHHEGDTARMRQAACRMHLEGIICKQADAPYRAGRSRDWLKVKCLGREEFVVLGWTEPDGLRSGLGALHLGYYDPSGNLHYAGGCGTGFSDETLDMLRAALDKRAGPPPEALLIAGETPETTIHWVRPDLVVETSFTGWSGAGRVRHCVFLGLREDKAAADVIREPADADAARRIIKPRAFRASSRMRAPVIAEPPKRQAGAAEPAARQPKARNTRIVTARAPKSRTETVEGVTITHPDRALWPGISKRDLAEYWVKVADRALPGLARRPLAILRCPEGVDGEHFFQKHAHGAMPPGIREDAADKAPYLAVNDLAGLLALAQMSAIELHVWGAAEADPLHADQLVFDLDPGEGVAMPAIVAAARDMRQRLEAIGLNAFCRTSGGKGLHVVVPLLPEQPWDAVRAFSKRFAEAVSAAAPDKYIAHVRIADRKGRILIDWLRNGLGSTAVASFCPRARPGAAVATPLAWREVAPKLDPGAFTIRTVPGRLAKLKADPWDGFDAARRPLPVLQAAKPGPARKAAGHARIVTAKAPRKRAG